MCSYLIKIGSTYHFRRSVPKGIAERGLILTARGNPRKEWNISLDTKDHETAKRLRVPLIVDTDRQIDEARAEMTPDPPLSSEALLAQARAGEEAAAMAALAAESRERQDARGELRTLWRKRRATSRPC